MFVNHCVDLGPAMSFDVTSPMGRVSHAVGVVATIIIEEVQP